MTLENSLIQLVVEMYVTNDAFWTALEYSKAFFGFVPDV